VSPRLELGGLALDLVPRARREGKTSFEAAGGPRAYFGWPADATAEEGRALIDALGSILEQAVQAERSVDAGRPW